MLLITLIAHTRTRCLLSSKRRPPHELFRAATPAAAALSYVRPEQLQNSADQGTHIPTWRVPTLIDTRCKRISFHAFSCLRLLSMRACVHKYNTFCYTAAHPRRRPCTSLPNFSYSLLLLRQQPIRNWPSILPTSTACHALASTNRRITVLARL